MALSQNGRSSRRRTNDVDQPRPARQSRDTGGHLPSAPRERRPLLAALAVLLIVGGALLAGLLAMRLDQRVQMLAAKDTIKAGQVINKEDLVSASVASDLTTLVRADQIDQVVGRTASGKDCDLSLATTGADTIPLTVVSLTWALTGAACVWVGAIGRRRNLRATL